MSGWFLVFAAMQVPVDTVTLAVDTALDRGLAIAPALEASGYRVEAASRSALQAGSWPNPLLGVSVENLGQSEEFTGIPGAEGLEGQAILTVPLPLGKERSGSRLRAEAEALAAKAGAEATVLQFRTELLASIGALLRDQVLVTSAREEADALDGIAEALAAQAEAGRAPAGDAARARLAAGMAHTRLARREGAFVVSSAEISRRLGYAASTVVRLDAPVCTADAVTGAGGSRGAGRVSGDAPASGEAADEELLPPELRAAEARVDAARGATEVARGTRMPDFAPQVGVRRTQGQTGLYVGLATSLPLFDRGSERIGASIAEENTAMAERRDLEQRWEAARAGARGVLESLERAGAHFDGVWFESVDQTVEAAEARYELGEGTLFELLDGRRARLQALDDYALWMSEWWGARLELERLDGRAAPASVICMNPFLGER
jgi:cobalt-zinc-cadmium efflux system outer membrane protein